MEGSSSSGKPHVLCPTSFQTNNDALRAKIQEFALERRTNARADLYDNGRFGLGELKCRLQKLENLNEKDVHGLSSRIKRRKHASYEDMFRLHYAFLQSNENINSFVNNTGALQVIIKELTGTDSELPVSAVECLCNLSLGQEHVCEKLSKFAGCYLVIYLDSSDERLKRACLWTIANIIATSIKATETLLRMELIRKLWAKYMAINGDYCEDAAICLVLLSKKPKKLFPQRDWQFILENSLTKNPTSVAGQYHLQIIFNFGLTSPENQLEEAAILYFVNYALSNLHSFHDFETENNRLRIIFAVRVLGNLLASSSKTYHILLQQLGRIWQSNLNALFNKLFALPEKTFIVEALWLLKNIIALHQELPGFEVRNFLGTLRLPKSNFESFQSYVSDI